MLDTTAHNIPKMLNWPVYFKDRLTIDNLDSNVGVVTLWMPKDAVVAELNPGSFAVCGQLYTKRGINPLLRNIFANPKIRFLVICGVDRQGSGEALLKFFKNGVEENNQKGGWSVIGDSETLLDREIPSINLDFLRESVEVIDLRLAPLEQVRDKVIQLNLVSKDSFTEPILFPDPPITSMQRYPSDLSVFKVKRKYISEAWIDVLKTINRFGVIVPGMYGAVRELHNMSIVIEQEDTKKPKLESYLNFDKSGLDLYIKGFFEKNPGSEAYTYGERLYAWDGIDQINLMITKLSRFEFDRGAVAVLWKPHKDNFPPNNTEKVNENGQTKGWSVPCLSMILGQCLDDMFNMTAIFRSNDMFGAWPLNAFALRSLQETIAEKIGKGVGSLTTISHIAEIYEIDWESSINVVAQNDSLARTCRWDPRGYYSVEVSGSDIILRFFNPDGSQQLAEFIQDGHAPKAARDLCALSIKDMLISDLGAACDLGRQLAKAENAIKLGLIFEQDNPLKFPKQLEGVINLR